MKSCTLFSVTSSQPIELEKKKLDKLIRKYSPFQLVDFFMKYKEGNSFAVNIVDKVYTDRLKIFQEHQNAEMYDNVFAYIISQSLNSTHIRGTSVPSQKDLLNLLTVAYNYVNHTSGSENFVEALEENLQRGGDQILNFQKSTNPTYPLISLFSILQKLDSEDSEVTEIEKILNYSLNSFGLSYILIVFDIISSNIIKNQQSFLRDYNFESILNKEQNSVLKKQMKIWINRLTYSRKEVKKFTNIKGITADPEYENFSLNPIRVFPLMSLDKNKSKYQIPFVNLISNSVGQIFMSHMDDILKENPKIKQLFHKKFGEFFELYNRDLIKACMNSKHQIIMNEDLLGYFNKKKQKKRSDDILLEENEILLFEYKKGLRIKREVINNDLENNETTFKDFYQALEQLETTKNLIITENRDNALTKDKGILKFLVVYDENFSFIGNFKSKLEKDTSCISSNTIARLQPYLRQGLITFKKLHELLKEGNKEGELGTVTKIEENFRDKLKDQSNIFMEIKSKKLLDIVGL